MTDQKQNMTVTEALGWKRHFGDGVIVSSQCWVWIDPNGRRVDGLFSESSDIFPYPDYGSNLNACHEMEKFLREDSALWDDYGIKLGKIILGERWWLEVTSTQLANAAHATAAQRREAFLRTLNLYTD